MENKKEEKEEKVICDICGKERDIGDCNLSWEDTDRKKHYVCKWCVK